MQGVKRSDAHRHREHLQRRSAPAAGEPKVQVIPERVLSKWKQGACRYLPSPNDLRSNAGPHVPGKNTMKEIAAIVAALAVISCGGTDTPPASINVYKSLGSVQCTGGGTTLSALQAQLTGAGVPVMSSSCGNDGTPHPALCGASDGAIGIVEIPLAQQVQATTLNFAPLSSLPTAYVASCH